MASRLVPLDDSTTRESIAPGPSTLVIGNFDGVHRGHQATLNEAVAIARARGLEACALTFDPHPGAVVGRGAPPLLTTLEERAERMGDLGIERLYVRRFDAAFAAWQPERFVRDLLAGVLRARCVVVGDNFRFGARRAGDLAMLRALGGGLGLEVRVAPVASDERGPFSSTRVREAVAAGDVGEAARVLGRPHAATGVVVHGDERGRKLQFPTANLGGVVELLPPRGVYAVTVEREQAEGEGEGAPRRFVPLGRGVTNVGVRPTVNVGGGAGLSIETHLLDLTRDLYGARLRVSWRSRLRDEKKFASLDELKAQIARDVAEARDRLGR